MIVGKEVWGREVVAIKTLTWKAIAPLGLHCNYKVPNLVFFLLARLRRQHVRTKRSSLRGKCHVYFSDDIGFAGGAASRGSFRGVLFMSITL